MKACFVLLTIFLVSSTTEAQIIPFSYGKARTRKTTIEISERNNVTSEKLKAEIDSVLKKLKSKLTSEKRVSIYSKASDTALLKAAKLKVEINEDFESKLQQITAAINATLDKKERDKLKQELKDARQDKSDQINGIYKDVLNIAKEFNYYHLNENRLRLFPVRNAVGAQLFYENEVNDERSSFLRNTIVRWAPDGGKASLFNELFADYAGAFRVGVGMLISNKSDVTDVTTAKKDSLQQQDAIQRLVGGGGNFVINFSYPLMGYTTLFNNFSTKLIFAPKLNIDVPQLGTEKSKTAVSPDLGLEGTVFYTMENKVFTVFSNYRFGYIFGNKNFYQNLLKTDEKGFAFHQFIVGLAINSTFRITWNTFFGDQFVRSNFNQSIGFSIVPK
jgi:hypothetical protein